MQETDGKERDPMSKTTQNLHVKSKQSPHTNLAEEVFAVGTCYAVAFQAIAVASART